MTGAAPEAEPPGISPSEVTVIVIAKEPRPGRAKTRLIPALGEAGAARLAGAALADTLDVVAALPEPRRRVLALDGEPGPWLPAGFEVIPQRGEGLAARLAAAFGDAGGPAFLIGMDTPQITLGQIERACERLAAAGTGAVIGLAPDGGWWGLGLRRADDRVFDGVPMSTAETGSEQTRRLDDLGLRWEQLDSLRDIDTIDDARAVAGEAPRRRFARVLVAERSRMAKTPGAAS
ncbi:MAG TPA: TIGR04282 family arsenosugar biosynthesis glycosyltransferase [Solirubrobacterales bacterium]|nr:TIGR04282 family arsenosugar biosynthesis glycosyltransferase [Solirubrobacterales bacterium]